MWNTTYERDEQGRVEKMTHDFGQQIRVETNFKHGTVQRIHGQIVIKEFAVDPSIEHYTQMLNNIDKEVNKEN